MISKYDKSVKLNIDSTDLHGAKFELSNGGKVQIRTGSIDSSSAKASAQLEAWKMQGLTTIAAIEAAFNFNFVTTTDQEFALKENGEFLVVRN